MKTRWRLLWVLLALILGGVGAHVDTAQASIVVQMSVESLTQDATTIVVGRVVETRASWTEGDHGAIVTDVVVEVEESIKGAKVERLTFRVMGGRVDDLAQRVPGEPVFRRGERALLFLDARPGGRLGVLGMGQGCYRIHDDPASGVEVAIPALEGLSLAEVEPLRAGETRAQVRTIHEPSPQPLALDSLRQQIEAQLASPRR